MGSNNKTQIRKDLSKRQINVIREFDAPVDKVWEAWTNRDLLDEWWAPKPWKTESKSMDFRQGGVWMYAMAGPDGTKQWCRVDYKTIVPEESLTGYDAFCDEQGNINNLFPRMFWQVHFEPSATGTAVNSIITFDSEDDLYKILEMGFAEGFTAAHGNLDTLLQD